MERLEFFNPFRAPVYYEETVTSTMDISRKLAAAGEPHGTVITADFQEAGRGRIRERGWETEKNTSLLFTILLRFPSIEAIPLAITLRTGLAVVLAIEEFAPAFCGTVTIKWPNDVMIGSKKAAGILCEADGGIVHTGIGINVTQKKFSGILQNKATSIAIAQNRDISPAERFTLLQLILRKFYNELDSGDWRSRLEQRLYKKGENVSFMEGAAESGNLFKGRLAGIGQGGELLIEGTNETRAFITGELLSVYQ